MNKQKVFGEKYSVLYDYLYQTKDYKSECDFIEELFKNFDLKVKTILDLGCGTGGHLIPLAKRGYQVTGLDRSKNMLDIAQKKIKAENLNIDLVEGDIVSFNLNKKFDAIIAMFASMSYIIKNEDINLALQSIRKHLKSNGAFIFDVWYEPSILMHPPTQRIKRMKIEDKEIIRLTEPIMDIQNHMVDNWFELLVIDKDRIILRESEHHRTRFFHAQEIAYYLENAKFSSINYRPFKKPDGYLTDSDWYMTIIALVL